MKREYVRATGLNRGELGMTDIKKYEPLWGAWYVDSLIGEGSFGKVYKVRQEEFGNVYHSAVKLITFR